LKRVARRTEGMSPIGAGDLRFRLDAVVSADAGRVPELL
jgi:hypothetical protein